MRYYLAKQASLKLLETPSIYHIGRDELYELDDASFRFLQTCLSSAGCESSDREFIDYCLIEGLLTADGVPFIIGPPVAAAPVPSLRYLELQITDRCNLRCRHCYIGSGTGREMPLPLVRDILKELEEMQGLRVLLTGGEPLLHSQFDAINELLPGLFIRSVLFTNGLLLTPELLKRLRVHEIQISVDGMEDAHDALRGRGTWRKAVHALRMAVDEGFPVSVSTMVHKANLRDFEAMEELFRSLNIAEWAVDIPCAAGRHRENPELFVSPDEGGKLLAYGYGGGMHGSGEAHACGLHLMAILADGTAAKCTFYADRPAGNVREGLRTCWSRITPLALQDLDCRACEFLTACRGGCRYRAEITRGPGGRDPFRCSLYGVVDKSS